MSVDQARFVNIAVEYGICPSLDNRKYSILPTMYARIFVVAVSLCVTDIICAEVFKVMPLELGTSGTIPCDPVKDDPEVRLVQWYKSRNIDAFENGNPSLASWADGATGSQPNYHMENTTFSLVIEKATLEDEGLYKCSVVRGDVFTDYYTRTVMYGLPRMDPKITLDSIWNCVNCTVEHVKPLIYPVFNFDWVPDSTEIHAVLNEDGTYTTSVCCVLPQTKSASRVDCSLSYLHYQRTVSLALRDITTDSLMGNEKTTVSPMGTSLPFAGNGFRTIHHTKFVNWKIYIGLTMASFTMLIV